MRYTFLMEQCIKTANRSPRFDIWLRWGFLAVTASYMCYLNLEVFTGTTLWQHIAHLSPHGLSLLLTVFSIIVVMGCVHYSSLYHIRNLGIPEIILGIMLGFCMVTGYAFEHQNALGMLYASPWQIIKTLLHGIGWALVGATVFSAFFTWMDNKKIHPTKVGKHAQCTRGQWLNKLVTRHTFALPLTIILVGWLPYYISCFPGLFTGDTSAQISTWFFYRNLWVDADYIVNGRSYYLSTAFPLVHTAFLGWLVELGWHLGSPTIGYAVYTTIQFTFVAYSVAYAASRSLRCQTSIPLVITAIALVTLVPVFPTFALLGTKDIFFSAFFLIFIVNYTSILLGHPTTPIDNILFAISGAMFPLLRNGTIVIAIIAFIAMLIVLRRRVPKLVLTAATTAICLYSLITYILVPVLGIQPGMTKELLSAPIQQIARFVNYYPNEVTPEEYEYLDSLVGFENMQKNYNPDLADSIKKGGSVEYWYTPEQQNYPDFYYKYINHMSKTDLPTFFSIWASIGKRHPGTYVVALLNLYYGYFYLGVEEGYHMYSIPFSQLCMDEYEVSSFGIHHIAPEKMVDLVTYWQRFWSKFPILKLITGYPCSLYVWLLLACTLWALSRRNPTAIATCCAMVTILAICLIGPRNALNYPRYFFPIMQALPFIIPLVRQWSAAPARK